MASFIKFSNKLPTLNQVERLLVDEAMKRAKGNKDVAANLLDISGKELDRHLQKKSLITSTMITSLIAILIILSPYFSHADETKTHVTGQVIVKFKPEASQEDIDNLLETYMMTIQEKIPQIGYYLLNLPGHYTVEDIITAWSKIDIVHTCEPNDLTMIQSLPTDVYFPDQWHLKNNGNRSGVKDADLQMEAAWEVESGDPSVIIAIIDMGFDAKHEDLQENIWNNPGEIPDNGIDDDHNGYVDDIIGWDFVNQPDGMDGSDYDWKKEDNDPTSKKASHGNSILGIIGATANNNIGVAGIAGKCKMMLIRAGYFKSDGTQSLNSVYIIKGLIYAADNGASVINISSGSTNYNQSYIDALRYAINKGALITCSAGNSGTSDPIYPAAYNIPGIISVGSTARDDGQSRFTNFGDWVDVSAPGEYIMTTLLDDRYGKVRGTSFASPMVAGVAALIFSKHPDLSPANVQDTIMNNVDIIEELSGACITSGRVNAYTALQNPTTDDYWSTARNNSGEGGSSSDSSDDILGGCFITTLVH